MKCGPCRIANNNPLPHYDGIEPKSVFTVAKPLCIERRTGRVKYIGQLL